MNNLIYILLFSFCSCQAHPTPLKNNNSNTVMTDSQSDTIIKKLVEDQYGEFFNYAIQEQIISAVWAEAGGAAPLKAIVIDETAPTKARLLACEVLMKNEFTFLRDEDVKIDQIATIYTNALENNTTGMANSWGFLYEHNDEGPIGIMLVMLGEKAIPELVKLLDNETIHLYQGSKEAMVGNAYQFRVKDFAAYYICRIKNIEAVYHETQAARDVEIEELKALLKEDK
ncbi:hypothetical protein [Aureispira sp. CCB-E]|uniref:hypothetical protein n=1 Tax=Aureispira sp. CCB-E TaxID=3051121 RepID=UPI0028686E9A|nr:hypothetical protein [Aureispira sp. CCB-E]WMX16662.1 hypothetical protein QP953_09810 [Aureispira sp. CCB-E]